MEPATTLRPSPPATLPLGLRLPLLLASALVVAAFAFPVVTAQRSRLTSDESLYASEALNIYAGHGIEYTTGRPVTHRAPLYPALLAADFQVAGVSLDAASWVPRIATVVNALLVLLVARRLAGNLAGLAAGLVAATSPFVNGLGASLFLDSVECSFILASLLLTVTAMQSASSVAALGAGAMLGLAILTKESAILLAPLPLVVALIAGERRGWRGRLAAFYVALGATAAWWWVWVYEKVGTVYLLGDAGDTEARAVLVAGVTACAIVSLLVLLAGRAALQPSRATRAAGVAFVLLWGVAAIAGLEWQSWEHPARYFSDVPAYIARVMAPAVPALPLMAAALVWCGSRTREVRSVTTVVVAAALFLPFVLFSANRELALRDSLPFLYFGAIALGCGCAWLVDWGRELGLRQRSPALGYAGAVVVATVLAAVVLNGIGRVDRAQAVLMQDDWDNQIANDTADWLSANVPAGTPVMSTRLYFSQVYLRTDGRYLVHQLPTVLLSIDPDAEALVSARSTLFRWETLPARSREHWLYLTRYTVKGYYVGLAEEDLLADLRERGTEYVVVNVSDAAFSSPAFLDYFDANPAFERIYERTYTPIDRTVIYRVDLGALAPASQPLRVTEAGYEGLAGRGVSGLDEKLGRLGSDAGFVLVP